MKKIIAVVFVLLALVGCNKKLNLEGKMEKVNLEFGELNPKSIEVFSYDLEVGKIRDLDADTNKADEYIKSIIAESTFYAYKAISFGVPNANYVEYKLNDSDKYFRLGDAFAEQKGMIERPFKEGETTKEGYFCFVYGNAFSVKESNINEKMSDYDIYMRFKDKDSYSKFHDMLK